MSYTGPTEIYKKTDAAEEISDMLDKRFNEWWILDRIIDCGHWNIYYFKNVEEANAVLVNDV